MQRACPVQSLPVPTIQQPADTGRSGTSSQKYKWIHPWFPYCFKQGSASRDDISEQHLLRDRQQDLDRQFKNCRKTTTSRGSTLLDAIMHSTCFIWWHTCKTRGRKSDKTGACAMTSKMTQPTPITPTTVEMGRLGSPSSPGTHPAPLLPEFDLSTTYRT